MATNLNLDDELIREAQELGGFKTKREAVTAALVEYVRFKKQIGIIELFGTVEYDDDYDYKAARGRPVLPELD
jgi:hypothetical protein